MRARGWAAASAVVEQCHRSCDLLLADSKFLGDLSVNASCHAHTCCERNTCGAHSTPLTRREIEAIADYILTTFVGK
jgi:hypothetical protein